MTSTLSHVTLEYTNKSIYVQNTAYAFDIVRARLSFNANIKAMFSCAAAAAATTEVHHHVTRCTFVCVTRLASTIAYK
jgi:hypothetical protein